MKKQTVFLVVLVCLLLASAYFFFKKRKKREPKLIDKMAGWPIIGEGGVIERFMTSYNTKLPTFPKETKDWADAIIRINGIDPNSLPDFKRSAIMAALRRDGDEIRNWASIAKVLFPNIPTAKDDYFDNLGVFAKQQSLGRNLTKEEYIRLVANKV